MSIEATARAALAHFGDQGEAILITAIAGAESGWDEFARGDPATGKLKQYAGYACDGYLSFGVTQVFLGVWASKVAEFSGLDVRNPCALAGWLQDENNALRMAKHIRDSQGWTAWSAYNAQTFAEYMDSARAAVMAALPEPTPSMPRLVGFAFSNGQLRLDFGDGSQHVFSI